MIYYDKKSYEDHRDTIIKLLKAFNICILILALTGCYNAMLMNAPGESRMTCQSDSDCRADYVCVRNISPDSTLGECVHENEYDPWANRQLEDIIKLKNKTKKNKKDVK